MSDRASSVPLEHKPSEPRPASSATPAPSAAVSKEHRAGAGVVSSTSVPSGSDAPHIAFLFEKDGRYKKELCFFLNGSKVVETNVQPDMSLLTYLRSPKIGLTGTKLGCGEGGCGACTVMISHWDHTHRQVVNRSVNACLFPLAAVDGHHVITVEGIGNVKAGLHPIQERIAALHGSQCGFCTPGIVMALYAFLRNNPNPTREQIEESFDGNLCRCTGYRPILEAAKTFAIDAESPCGLGAACCRNKNKGGQSAEQKAEPVQLAHGHALAAEFAAEAKRLPLDPSKNVQNREAFDPPSQATLVQSCTCAKVDCFRGCTRKSAESELIFPSELTHYNAHPLFFKGEHCVWFRPTTLQDLLQIKAQYPAAKLVVGNTELGIEMTLGKRRYPELIHTAAVPELNQLEVTEKGMYIGASVTLTNLKSFLQTLIKHREHDKKLAHTVYAASSMLTALRYFSSTQIRNSAAIGGNICTASPISDLNPVLQSLGAQLYLQSKEHAARNIDIREFFLAYRRTLLSGHEILVKIFVPFTVNNEFAFSFKQARRRDDDIAIVTSGMRVLLDAPTPHPQLSEIGISAADFKVKDVTLSFGGMAPVTTCAKLTQEFLKGKSWTEDTIQACYPLLAQDLPLPPQVPGGQAEYRSALAASFLFKFYVLVSSELQKQFKIALMPPSYESAIREYHRGVSMGRQEYNVPATANASDVGKPLQHLSSKQQVSGEAKYTDDLPTPQGGLFAALVLSQQPNAHIEVNANAALRMPGVVAYIGAKDVPGSNAVGDIVTDEELFAEKTVTCCGQVIGLILAHTEVEAQRAADAVQVTYTPTDKPTIITIEAAITNNSFQGPTHTVQRGDLEAAKKQSDFQIEGEMRIGGQEHFYLETNCCQAFPGENDEMTIICSTQNPHKTQEWAAHVLGIPESRVTAQVKRMGGGFGGKETRSLIYSSAIAVAAHKLQRPVRLNVRRDQDMSSSGHRHPFLGKYKAGCSKDGLLKYVDIQLFSNGGNSMDLSMPVCDRALFHIDNAYFIPAVKAVGRVCKTNIPSNTAFRGFGGPQGMMVCESILEHVAHTVGLPVTAVRERNLYKEGQQTHYLQTLDRCHIGRMWQEIKQSADFDARRRAVDQFNAENKFRKRGIALIPTKFGCSFTAKFMNQGGALVHVYTDGSVMITHGGTEMGQGLHTKMAQIAANAFGVPISQITVAPTATDKVPNTSPTAASMSSDINGMALLDACNTIKARLAPLREKNPDKTFAEIAKMAYFERINLSAQGFHKVPDVGYDWNTNSGQPFAYFTYGVACAEVDVDVLTGDFHVARADIVMDLGASLNPGIDVGQVEGAFVQGMGWCTMEELIWGDEEHKWVKPGFLATRGPGAYKIPSFNDVPVDFRVTLLKDSANPKAIYSSKAVGEPPFFLSASVFFALKDAVQSARKDNSASEFVPFFSPATSERIRMACNDKVAQLYTKDRTQAQDGKFRPCGSW